MWKSYLESNSNFVLAPADRNFTNHAVTAAGPSTSTKPSTLDPVAENTRPSDAQLSAVAAAGAQEKSARLSCDFKFPAESLIVSPCTPVLFTTNRGLQLRTRQTWRTFGANNDSAAHYHVQFCDLERWNSNRAHVLSICQESGEIQPETDSNRMRSVGFGLERHSSNIAAIGPVRAETTVNR